MNKIQFIGYSAQHSEDFIYDFPDNHDFYLLVLTHSPAGFLIDHTMTAYPPHTAILYPPGYRILYGAYHADYENDWIRFVTDETFVTNFPLKAVPFAVSDPEYCHHLFKLLTWESSFRSANSEMILSDLLRILFSKLHSDSIKQQAPPHAHELLELRKHIYNRPQFTWNVAQMADKLHLSTGYLQALYKNMFGISCMEDVIESRMRMAKDQLIHTSNTINEIAEFCGYNNVEHFCRQFHRLCGCTPGQFRKRNTDFSRQSKATHTTIAGADLIQAPDK